MPTVTTLKDAQEEQSLLLQFVYQCPVGLAEVDNQGDFRLLNALGVALLMPIAGGVGLDNFFQLMRPLAPELVKLIENGKANGEICRDHRVAIPRGDQAGQFSFTVIKLEANAVMIAFQDVTKMVDAERRAREALEAQALQTGRVEMAATVLHDIGNAVTGIGTRSAQLLADPPWPEIENLGRMSALLQSQAALLAPVLGERKAAALGGLSAAIERSLRQREITLREHVRSLASSVSHVQEILSVQRQYVHQRNGGQRNKVVLGELLHDAIAIQSAGLEKRKIVLMRRVAEDLPRIMLDRTRMVQVLSNIIRNACEAFDGLAETRGKRQLEIVAENLKPRWVRIAFRDSGNGFPPEKAETFFESGTTTKAQGSGLGLASCRSTVESHGGRIWMESKGVGEGATIIIDLPTDQNEDNNA